MSRQLSQAGNRRGIPEAGRQARNSGGAFRLPAAGPHSEVAGSGHPFVARHVCPQPGIQPVGVPAVLPDGKSGERGATLLCGVSGRASLAYVHGLAGVEAIRWQRGSGTESQPGISGSRNAIGGQRKVFAPAAARHHRNRAKAARRVDPHHIERPARGLERRHGGGLHQRIDGDRAAVAAHSGAQRGGGGDRRGSSHRRRGGDDEHRSSLDRDQDDAAEVRPAVVDAQDARQRQRTSARAQAAAGSDDFARGAPGWTGASRCATCWGWKRATY